MFNSTLLTILAKLLRLIMLIVVGFFMAFIFVFYTVYNWTLLQSASDSPPPLFDFKIFYGSIYDFFDKGSLYQVTAQLPFERILSSNNNTPIGSLFFLPFAPFPLVTAATLWTLVSLGLYLWAVILIWKVFPPCPAWYWKAGFLLALYVALPLLDTIQLGSWGMLIAFLDVAAWYYARRGQERKAGVFLGLAMSIRWQPFFIGLFMLANRQWRIFLYSLATAGILAVVALVVFGFNNFIDFASIVLQVGGVANQDTYDGSLRAFVNRLVFTVWGQPEGWTAVAYGLALWGGLLAVLAVTLWRSRRLNFDYGFSLAIVAGLLITPLSWMHYHVVLLLPVVVLMRHRYWPVVLTWVLWLSCNVFTPYSYDSNPLLFGSLLTLNLVVLYVGLYIGPRRSLTQSANRQAAPELEPQAV